MVFDGLRISEDVYVMHQLDDEERSDQVHH